MASSSPCMRLEMRFEPNMRTARVHAAATTMAASFVRMVTRIDASLHRECLDAIDVGGPRHVPDGALVLDDVLNDLVVGVELGGREVAPREDDLLPVVLDGGHRATEHVLGEPPPDAGLGVQIDGPDDAAVGPAGRLLEKRLGDEAPLDDGRGVARVDDDAEHDR